jgi:hypothetical protein
MVKAPIDRSRRDEVAPLLRLEIAAIEIEKKLCMGGV